MKICVFGLWHLGTVTAACMASLGYEVVGLDTDTNRIKNLNKGKAPLFEPDLDDLIMSGLSHGNLTFSSDPKIALASSELIWVTFDTPVNDEDIADTAFVIQQVKNILSYVQNGSTVLVSSQLPVGSIQILEKMARSLVKDNNLNFLCFPENLRLGKAVDIFLNPDRIVIGIKSEKDKLLISKLFESITKNILWMSIESAEMTKHALNSFLATSITFANEIASICEDIGADATDVLQALRADDRIGEKAYLLPGSAFAGGTLARDIVFLDKLQAEKGRKSSLISAVKPSNDEHKNWVKKRLRTEFITLNNVKVALWGLVYKPETSTLRRSLSVELCNWLLDEGAQVFCHDPAISKLPSQWVDRKVFIVNEPEEALKNADVLVLGTQWPVYLDVDPSFVVTYNKNFIVLDPNRYLTKWKFVKSIRYLSVGIA